MSTDAVTSDWTDKRVLVTGGAGFIGSHLVDALVRLGASVRVLDNLVSGRLENLESARQAIELIEGDIRDLEICRQAAEGVSTVFHQAALGSVPRSIDDPATSIEVNVAGTANVFAAARDAGVGRVVYASSSSVYGDSPTLPKREGSEGRVLSPYALSKRMNEQLAEVFGRCYDMELIGLRYFNVYGPRQDPNGPYAAVVPRFFAAFFAGQVPIIHGDGSQSRDFTFVRDAVEANLAAALAPLSACARTYNVARGERTSIAELARQIRRLTGATAEPTHGPPRAGDVAHSSADPTAAREQLDFTAEFTLERGLAACYDYYRGASRNQ